MVILVEQKEESKGHNQDDSHGKDQQSKMRLGHDVSTPKGLNLPPHTGSGAGMQSSSRNNPVGNGAVNSGNAPSKSGYIANGVTKITTSFKSQLLNDFRI